MKNKAYKDINGLVSLKRSSNSVEIELGIVDASSLKCEHIHDVIDFKTDVILRQYSAITDGLTLQVVRKIECKGSIRNNLLFGKLQ